MSHSIVPPNVPSPPDGMRVSTSEPTASSGPSAAHTDVPTTGHIERERAQAAERLQRAVEALGAPDGPLGRLHAEVTTWHARGRGRQFEGAEALAQSVAHEVEEVRAALLGLVELERLSAGTAHLNLQPLELGDLLMEIVPRWQERAPHHLFELALPGEVPIVIADADRVDQVVDALLDYSVRVSPDGGTIRVDIRPGADEVVVIVRQFRAVIDDAVLRPLFEPFFRHDDLPLAPAGGVGLALARAKAIAHGGRVWAERIPDDSGTALYLALPYLPETLTPASGLAVPDMSDRAALPPAGERVVPPRTRQVVLVVERDVRMQRYVRANLEARDYRVVLASTLDDAQQLIDLEEPDAVLLDPSVAPATGQETVSRIRASASGPVIVLARRHDPAECARVLDGGASDYVVKPFSPDELVARLRVALRAQQAADRATSRQPVLAAGALVVDVERRLVTVDGQAVALSKTEFKLLRALARHAGMVLSHDVLLEQVWGPDCVQEVAFLWVYIRRLRRKIEPDPSKPVYILTVPGVGYRLALPS